MLGREPVLWIALINAAIAIGVGFGLNVTSEQVGLINAGVIAVLSFVTRSQVNPVPKPPTP